MMIKVNLQKRRNFLVPTVRFRRAGKQQPSNLWLLEGLKRELRRELIRLEHSP